MIVTLGLLVLCGLYSALFVLYRLGWQRVPLRHGEHPPGHPRISVIIPARNEAQRLPRLLTALAAQAYPPDRYEVIVVDDFSDDETVAVAESFAGVRCLRMADMPPDDDGGVAYKKAALTRGIAAANGDYILTTDADCEAGPHWLSALAARAVGDNCLMLAAPVSFTQNGRVVELFQAVDFMMMQGITAAAHALKAGGMANGANLFFRRDAFSAVGGYSGTTHIASGDDYLLLAKFLRQFPGRVAYLKSRDAIVSTAPQPTWKSFLSQRIRWASKTGRYPDPKLTLILLLVYLFNCSLLVCGIAAIGLPELRTPLAGAWLIKVAAEILLFVPVARFFGQPRLILPLLLLQPLHVLYVVVAGFLGMVGSYTWKGRRVR